MEKEINVFDINDLSDLPEDLKRKIRIIGSGEKTDPVIELFRIKKELTINEIIVGLYRVWRIQKTRPWVSSSLYNLKRAKIIESSEKGTYRFLK